MFLIFDSIVDGPKSEHFFNKVDNFTNATPFNLKFNESFLSRIRYFNEDIDRLDSNEYLSLLNSFPLSISVMRDPAFPLVLFPVQADN